MVPGPAGLVAVIEMIGAGIVEVDGLLHEAQPERAGVEVEIAARRSRDRGDMVDAVLGMEPPGGGGLRLP